MRIAPLALAGCLAAVVGGPWPRAAGEEKADAATRKRVAELLAVIDRPDARTDNLEEGTVPALAELEKIGGPACPQLVEAVVGRQATNWGYVRNALIRIGKPALPAIRARWGDLNDERRWLLVPVLEKHDPGSVREYALNCLDADGPARAEAWGFVLRTKEPRAEERYFDALAAGGKVPPYIRWQLLPGDKPAYDEKRENDLLIELLKPDSWVAKGAGQVPPPGGLPPWWPDGRPDVIDTAHRRKLVRAAPALLAVLQEKGPGAGYLAHQLIPALADLGYKEAIPELERIAASKPGPGQREDLHPHALGGYKAVRELAAAAVRKLQDGKK